MADSNITISNLTAKGGLGQISLAWDLVDPNVGGLPYLQFQAVDVWASRTNDFATATKIGEATANTFTHAGLSRGETWYYWTIPRDRSNLEGARFPFSPTAGVSGTETNDDALLAETGFFQNSNGLLEQWGFTSQYTGQQTVLFSRRFSQIFSITATPYSHRTDLQFIVNLSGLDFDRITIGLTALSNGIPTDSDAVVWWVAKGMP